jgi:hypothetical protein
MTVSFQKVTVSLDVNKPVFMIQKMTMVEINWATNSAVTYCFVGAAGYLNFCLSGSYAALKELFYRVWLKAETGFVLAAFRYLN